MAGIEAPRDFVALVPNMTMVEVQNVGNSFITIRGISQGTRIVAVLVDGVLEPNPYMAADRHPQIEVLEEGAAPVLAVIGGAIMPHGRPPDHFEGTVRAGVGNGVSEKGMLTRRTDRLGRDAGIPGVIPTLQHRRLS